MTNPMKVAEPYKVPEVLIVGNGKGAIAAGRTVKVHKDLAERLVKKGVATLKK